jgi:hypothetical protein
MILILPAQITLVILILEIFVEFYRHTHHSPSATYLFFGLNGKHALVPWSWTSIALNAIATGILT